MDWDLDATRTAVVVVVVVRLSRRCASRWHVHRWGLIIDAGANEGRDRADNEGRKERLSGEGLEIVLASISNCSVRGLSDGDRVSDKGSASPFIKPEHASEWLGSATLISSRLLHSLRCIPMPCTMASVACAAQNLVHSPRPHVPLSHQSKPKHA